LSQAPWKKVNLARWHELSPLLDQALELAAEERSDWIEMQRIENPELVQELQALLADMQLLLTQGFLEDDPARILNQSLLDREATRAASFVGRKVGSYVIDAEIGSGGMGSVWRASRSDGRFEGYVAIKFVHPSCLGRDGEKRFQREGQVLARLSHASIARLIDAGVLDGSHPYLVMEYVEGEPIDAYCERAALDIDARVRLFLDVLAAVGHAHGHLVVHRDLKPSNVLVTRLGEIKLLDFGIAKLLDPSGEPDALTHASAVALTPHFAAPEQLLRQPVTTATDVYTLGLLLYVLLVGQHPLATESRSGAELIQAMLAAELPRPSLVASVPGTRRRELAGDLDNILGKALKKDPSERYHSVDAFAEDLERFLTHQPVHARPDTVSYRLKKFVRRNNGAVLGGLLVAVGLIATSAFALVQMFEARAQRDLAVTEAKRANAQSDLTAFIVGDTLESVPQDAVRVRLDRARKFIAARFRRDPLLAGRLLIDVSARYIDIGDDRTAAEVIEEAEAIGKRLNDSEFIAELACLRTQDFAIARDLPAARAQLATGLANMRRMRQVPPSVTAECASAVAFVAQADGDFAKAVVYMRDAVASIDAAGMHGAPRYTSASNDLARALVEAGRFHDAWEIENRNLALVRDSGRADTSAYLAMVSVGCVALRNGGQPRRALELVESVVADARRDAPNFVPPYFLQACRARNLIAMRRPEGGATLAQVADAAEKAGNLYAITNLRAASAALAIERGDLAGADAKWALLAPEEERLLALHEQSADAVLLILLHARMDLAHARVADALRRLSMAAALVASRHQPTNPDARDVELVLAQALMAKQAYSQAAEHAGKAVDLARAAAVDVDSSAWVGEALVWRARSEAAMGKVAVAAASAREALRHLEPNVDPAHPLIAVAKSLLSG